MLLGASFWGGDTGLAVVVGLCFLAAFLLVYMLVGTGMRTRRDRELAQRMVVSGKPAEVAVSQPVKSGAGGWIPASMAEAGGRMAEAGGFGASLDLQLEQANMGLRVGEFVVVTVLAAFGGGILGAVLMPNIIFVLLIAAVAALVPTGILRFLLGRRRDAMRDLLPDTLTIMAGSLRAGHSFLQALDTVSKEAQEPAASEFSRAVAEIRLGRPVDEALAAMAVRVGSGDFDWAVMAISIQREVGGNLAEILDTVADTIRERAMLRRSIQTLTAEGKISAYVLIALPLLIAVYMFLVNREYISLLYTTTIGWVMLATAGSLLVLGVLWMRKIINIDV